MLACAARTIAFASSVFCVHSSWLACPACQVAVRLCALTLLLWLPMLVSAQEAERGTPPRAAEQPPAAAPVIVPPQLLQFAQPEYPAAAAADKRSGRVEVELVVGVDGSTRDLKIKTSAGQKDLDDAALQAAAKLLFEPATRDGKQVPARIVFPFVFELAPAPVPQEPERPRPAKLTGRVVDGIDRQPLADVEVLASKRDPEVNLRAVTDKAGAFSFEELPAGQYRITLNKRLWAQQIQVETLNAGEALDVVYRMQEAEDREAFRAVARVAPPPREVTRRTITKEELTRIPGTRGDALRTVELLPGVARPPFTAGALIVRGSAPGDTQVQMEGVPVGLLYHFGGLTSFINSRLLESVDFYPGNFSVRYGRRRGGIIEVSLADPARDRIHGVADLNLIDGSVLVQGPITDKWEFAAAGRRSWIDLTIGQALRGIDDISTIAAPVYYDYQLLTTYRPSDRDKLRLMVYGSSDTFRLLFEQPSDADPTLSGDFNLATSFHRVQLSWEHKVSDRVDHDLELAVGVFDYVAGAGEAFDLRLRGTESYLRSEWRIRTTDNVQLIAGFDGVLQPGEVRFNGPPLSQGEGVGTPTQPSNQSTISGTDKFTAFQPAVYFESAFDLARLHVVLGSRIDYSQSIEAFSFDPRMSAHLALTDNTRLKGGIGIFSQPPQGAESSPLFGNPNLLMTRTLHTGLGVEHTFAPGIKVSLEGFYKYLYDRVISTEFGEAPRFTNDGTGRIYGLELSAKVDPRGRFFGYLSYTLSRSERRDLGDTYRLFDYDQPHILTLSGVYRLGRGWEAGLTFRLVAGNPATPVVGGILNADSGLYSPVNGAINSIRNPYFHRLDLRIEKLWRFNAWKLALYLDVQNVYNSSNPEGITYDYEYRQRTEVNGLPILPNLGLRGEL